MRPNRAKKGKERAPLYIIGQQQHVGLEKNKLVWQVNDGIADAYQFRFGPSGKNVSEPARQAIRNDYSHTGKATSRCVGVRDLGRRARHLHSPELFTSSAAYCCCVRAPHVITERPLSSVGDSSYRCDMIRRCTEGNHLEYRSANSSNRRRPVALPKTFKPLQEFGLGISCAGAGGEPMRSHQATRPTHPCELFRIGSLPA
jgi:hypothetical protein